MNVESKSYYSCLMHTQVRADSAGRCPICGMHLEPLNGKIKTPEEKLSNYFKGKFLLGLLLFLPVVLIELFYLSLSVIISEFALRITELFFSGCIIFIAGFPRLRQGLTGLWHFNYNPLTLSALAVLIAYAYSVVELFWSYYRGWMHQPQFLADFYFEPSSLIMLLLLLGQYVLALAQEFASKEIGKMTDLVPETAHLVLNRGEERKIAAEDLRRGDVLRVKPNELVPADGVIIEGQSWVNEAMLTGEALPIYKRPKDRVFAGSLNGNSAFVMTAEKVLEETLLSKILNTILFARKSKAPVQEKIDRFLAFFIPGVALFALAAGGLWDFFGASSSFVVGRVVTVMLTATPAAFALAVPMTMLVGLSLAARNGILIKEAAALELMKKVDTLVVDKTGVLTEGRPLLTKIFAPFPFSEIEVLRWGASVEALSDHPLAEALVIGAKLKQVELLKASSPQTLEGKGMIARIDGSRVCVGNRKLLEDLGVESAALNKEAEKWQKEGLTVSYVILEDRAVGLLGVADPLKYTAQRAIQQLQREKLKVILATGDSKEAAEATGKRLGVNEVYGDVLTQDKMALVQKLQRAGSEVAMAGDGVIDAPALSQADVGIALSPHDEPTCYYASISLLKGDLRGVVRARHLSQIVVSNIRQSLLLVIVYNLIALPLAAGFLKNFIPWEITPLEGCVLSSLASAVAILSCLRIRDAVLYQD